MTTKVLFVKSRCGERAEESPRPPLGIQYLSSFLKANLGDSAHTQLMDLRLPGVTWDRIVETVGSQQIDVVAISALSVEAGQASLLCDRLKSAHPNVPVVLGGPHATSAGAAVLDHTQADIAVLGEGEAVFCQLLRALRCHNFDARHMIAAGGDALSTIPSLVVRGPEGYRLTPNAPFVTDLDSLPFPDRSIIDESLYERTRGIQYVDEVFAPVLTSRGCPFRCTYCHKLDGYQFRKRSASNVLDELSELAANGRRKIAIVDDIFNFDKRRVAAICEGIAERGLELSIKFGNGLRTDLLTDRQVDLLAAAGVVKVCVAVETGSTRIMKRIKKRLRYDQVLTAIDRFRQRGVLTQGMFMLGFPDETLAEMKETVDYACGSALDMATFFKVVPTPGTELYEEAIALDPRWPEKLQSGEYWYHSRRSFYEDLTGLDHHSVWQGAFARFYDEERLERLSARGGPNQKHWSRLLERDRNPRPPRAI